MWKYLYLQILALLSPHAEDPMDLEPLDPEDPEPLDPEDPEPLDPEDPEPLDPEDPEPAPRESRAQREIRQLRERAQAAETARQVAEAKLEAAHRQPQQNQPTEAQQLWEQEEAILRDPNAEPWQRYAVESNRRARAAEQNSQTALRQAEDMADRTKFEQLKLTKPKVYEQYADRVEAELAKHRANGVNPPREGLLAYLLGADMLAGKAKVADTKPKGGAPRERPPGARSDVRSSGGNMTEAEKRAKRLENVRI